MTKTQLRLAPLPVPAVRWDDEPTFCLWISDEWVSHILGQIEPLDSDDSWSGTAAEKQDARDQIAEIMSALAEGCEMLPPYFVGEIRHFAAENAIPDGWEICQGQAISRTDFADLFAVVGGLYGVGDGTTTFNVPNFMGRTLVGATGGGDYTPGATGGEEFHALIAAENGPHTHTGVVSPNNPLANRALVSTGGVQTVRPAGTSDSSGNGDPHENRMPFLVVHAAIYSGVLDA